MQAKPAGGRGEVQMIAATQTDFTVNYISNPQSGQRGVWDISCCSGCRTGSGSTGGRCSSR